MPRAMLRNGAAAEILSRETEIDRPAIFLRRMMSSSAFSRYGAREHCPIYVSVYT